MRKRFKHTYVRLGPQGFISCYRVFNRIKLMAILSALNPCSSAYDYIAEKLSRRVYLTWWTSIY